MGAISQDYSGGDSGGGGAHTCEARIGLLTGVISGKASFSDSERPKFIDALIDTIFGFVSQRELNALFDQLSRRSRVGGAASAEPLNTCENNKKSSRFFKGGIFQCEAVIYYYS